MTKLPNHRTGIYFGQLLGMADHLTFTLGRAGFQAYKVCMEDNIYNGLCVVAHGPQQSR